MEIHPTGGLLQLYENHEPIVQLMSSLVMSLTSLKILITPGHRRLSGSVNVHSDGSSGRKIKQVINPEGATNTGK